jgi:hypothetical protein
MDCIRETVGWSAWQSRNLLFIEYDLSTARVRFQAVQDFSLHSVQTGCGVRPAPYPMGTVGSFLWGKAAGA